MTRDFPLLRKLVQRLSEEIDNERSTFDSLNAKLDELNLLQISTVNQAKDMEENQIKTMIQSRENVNEIIKTQELFQDYVESLHKDFDTMRFDFQNLKQDVDSVASKNSEVEIEFSSLLTKIRSLESLLSSTENMKHQGDVLFQQFLPTVISHVEEIKVMLKDLMKEREQSFNLCRKLQHVKSVKQRLVGVVFNVLGSKSGWIQPVVESPFEISESQQFRITKQKELIDAVDGQDLIIDCNDCGFLIEGLYFDDVFHQSEDVPFNLLHLNWKALELPDVVHSYPQSHATIDDDIYNFAFNEVKHLLRVSRNFLFVVLDCSALSIMWGSASPRVAVVDDLKIQSELPRTCIDPTHECSCCTQSGLLERMMNESNWIVRYNALQGHKDISSGGGLSLSWDVYPQQVDKFDSLQKLRSGNSKAEAVHFSDEVKTGVVVSLYQTEDEIMSKVLNGQVDYAGILQAFKFPEADNSDVICTVLFVIPNPTSISQFPLNAYTTYGVISRTDNLGTL